MSIFGTAENNYSDAVDYRLARKTADATVTAGHWVTNVALRSLRLFDEDAAKARLEQRGKFLDIEMMPAEALQSSGETASAAAMTIRGIARTLPFLPVQILDRKIVEAHLATPKPEIQT